MANEATTVGLYVFITAWANTPYDGLAERQWLEDHPDADVSPAGLRREDIEVATTPNSDFGSMSASEVHANRLRLEAEAERDRYRRALERIAQSGSEVDAAIAQEALR